MSQIKFFLFGRPYIEVAGQIRELKRQPSNSIALIAYLAMAQNGHKRDYLETLLWPEQSPDSSNFRVLLSRLRSQLPELAPVLKNKNILDFSEVSYWCDANRFNQLLEGCFTCKHIKQSFCDFCLLRWEEMTSLYRGDFLHGLDMSHSAEYDAWQRISRDKFANDVSMIYNNIVDYYIVAGKSDLALSYTQKWVEHDYLNEDASCKMVKLLLHKGQHTSAQNYYEEFEYRYTAEYEITPEKTFADLLDDSLITLSGKASDNQALNRILSSSRIRIIQDASQIRITGKFVGRVLEKEQIQQHLSQSRRCLIHGLAGIGKTTLVKSIACERLYSENHEVIWIEFGHHEADDLLDELAKIYKQDHITKQSLAEKQDSIRRFLIHKRFTMVLDDVWNETALAQFLRAIPSKNAVLITSRLRIVIDGIILMDLSELSDDLALELLSYHADQVLHPDEGTQALCQILNGHPFSIEIAGRLLMKRQTQTPRELASEIALAPHHLKSSRRASTQENGTFADLLSKSIQLLRDESLVSYEIFVLMGMLPTASATLRLLHDILGEPEAQLKESLWHLHELALLKYYDNAVHPNYEMHSLTFSYATSLEKPHHKLQEQVLNGIETFVIVHAQDYEQLGIEIENILGIILQTNTTEVLIRVVEILMVQGYFYTRGFNHTPALLACAERAIDAARKYQPQYNEQLHYLLGKRADAAYSQKQYDVALNYYTEGLDIAPNTHQEAIFLSLIASVFHRQKRYEESKQYFAEAQHIAEKEEDKPALIRIIEYEGTLALEDGHFETARPLLENAVELSRGTQDERRLFLSLYNLSMTLIELDCVPDAHETLREAQAIAELQDNNFWRAATLSGIARVYHVQGQSDQAQTKLNEALKLYREYGAVAQIDWVREFCQNEGYDFLPEE